MVTTSAKDQRNSFGKELQEEKNFLKKVKEDKIFPTMTTLVNPFGRVVAMEAKLRG